MSDDGSNEPFISHYEDASMEIVVETLTGTTFEMTVLPNDTIMAIKSKIQRIEGIPVFQQHLLFRLKELNNDDRLCDHGVIAGSTLRLILSMRGGPISTRRLISSDNHFAWKELKKYVDTPRGDMSDKLPPGSKITVLLFRDGENVNLIRVIENEDGMCYPYSDSWLSQKNVPKELSQETYRQRSNENNIMMHKIIELRKKMEGFSMQKKAKKFATRKTETELEESSSSGLDMDSSLAEIENKQKLFRTLNDPLQVGKNISDLYSDRFLLLQQRRNSNTNLGYSQQPQRLNSTLSKSEDILMSSRNCACIEASSIAILEEEPNSALNEKEMDFSPGNSINLASEDANTVTVSQIPSLPGSSRNLLHVAHVLQDPERPKTSPGKYDPQAQEFCNALFNNAAERSCNSAVKLSVTNRRQSLDFSNKTILPRIQFTSNSNSKIDNFISNNCDTNSLLTSQYTSTSKLNSAHLDNMLGMRINDISKNDDQIERKLPFFGRRARTEKLQTNVANNSNSEKYEYNNLSYVIENDKQSIPQYGRRSVQIVSNLETQGCNTSDFKLQSLKVPKKRWNHQEKLGTSTTQSISSSNQFPVIVPKKTTRTRCAFCNKRLNITTTYTCRCGGIFCSQHRYSEIHECQYDYKTEGRKILERTNPLVTATKLPKI